MIKKITFNIRRIFNRIVHRYIIVSIITFILSRCWIFNNPNHISDNRLIFAILSIVLITFFLGKRSALYACFIVIGFLVSMFFYGEKNIMESFSHVCWFCKPSINVVVTWICLAFSPIMLVVSYTSNHKIDNERKKTRGTREKLYQERKELFDAILEYITNHSVVGINSVYGNGKSTIVEALKTQKEKEWNFITISLLSTKVENVEFYIVREIERFLESNGMYTNSISKIKSLFSHDFSFCIGELLFEKQSYEDQMRNFVDDIRGLKKVIVLNFEDIDRISDKEHVKKIFAICDSLLKYESKFPVEDRFIKVIYQCNIDTLNNMFQDECGEKRYVEKFIPRTFSLNPLTGEFFKRVLENNQNEFKNIKDVQFDFLNANLKHELLQQEASYSFLGHSIRGIEQVLDNVNSTFERDGTLAVSKPQDVEPVIVFYIAKYFLPRVYEMLEENVESVKQKMFYDKDGKVYSFAEIREMISVKKENEKSIYGAMSFRSVPGDFFNENFNKTFKENREALFFLILLGYNDEFFDEKNNTAEKYNVMKQKEEVLNRLIRFS